MCRILDLFWPRSTLQITFERSCEKESLCIHFCLTRRRLQTEVDGLVYKSADEFAQKAEDTGKLVWISKSNSLRRAAKEKEKTRKDLDNKIVNVVNELKKA